MKGYFITFEGCDGSGKSEQANLFANYLAGRGEKVISLRAPGSTQIGEEIRHILQHVQWEPPMEAYTELLLLSAAGAQLVGQTIKPALAEGKIVVCDRFSDSSLAYQGYGRNLGLENVQRALDIACQGLKPDLTFFINLPPSQSMQNVVRDNKRQGLHDRFESESLHFHKRVYQGYLEVIAREPERFRVIDFIPNDMKAMHNHIAKEFEAYRRKN